MSSTYSAVLDYMKKAVEVSVLFVVLNQTWALLLGGCGRTVACTSATFKDPDSEFSNKALRWTKHPA